MTKKFVEQRAVENFQCLANNCPRSCCKSSWHIPVDENHIKMFAKQAPCLISTTEQLEDKIVFKRDEQGNCVNLSSQGFCKIHSDHGEEMLPDVCFQYPKTIKNLDNNFSTSLAMSCIESARIILDNPKNSDLITTLNKPVREELSQEINIKNDFDDVVNSVQQISEMFLSSKTSFLNNFLFLSKSFDFIEKSQWPSLIKSRADVLDIQENVKLTNESSINQMSRLFQCMLLMIKATGKNPDAHLKILLDQISNFLEVNYDLNSCDIIFSDQSNQINSKILKITSHKNFVQTEKMLQCYGKWQISSSFFPYATQFKDFSGRISEIANWHIIKWNILKLSLLATHNHFKENVQKLDLINIVVTTSKLLDHFPNSDLIMKIIEDFGWNYGEEIAKLISLSNANMILEKQ